MEPSCSRRLPRRIVRRHLAVLFLILSVLGGWPGGVVAAGKPGREDPEAAAHPVVTAVLAARVAAYGQSQNDPLALLVAARLLNSASSSEHAGRASAAWLDSAFRLAGTRSDLLGWITDARVARHRGEATGAEAQTLRVSGREAQSILLSFNAGSDAAVALTDGGAPGSAPLDLDLYVFDERGAAVCASQSPGMPEQCRWTPRRSGKFRIVVENRLTTPAECLVLVHERKSR